MSKITSSANGEQCQIRVPGICLRSPATVVWCHANGSAAGKGIGSKSDDRLGSYGCRACHDLYDRRALLPDGLTMEYVKNCFYEGHMRSFRMLIKKGLV